MSPTAQEKARQERARPRQSSSRPLHMRPPLQKRSRATMELFASATEDLLRERPFEEITVQEIALQAGRPIGSFYARFPSKEALLPYLYERYDQSLETSIRARLEEADWERLDLRETVALLVDALTSLYENRRWLLRSLALFARQHPEALSEELIARRRHIYDLVSEILLRHRRRIVHENPEGAVRFGIYLVSAAARDALLFSEAPHAKATSLKVEPLRKELARTLYAYLTVRSA